MKLLQPIRTGALELPNRMVMAPMSRARSDANRVPNAVVAQYYGQRASAGLIVTEATAVGPLSVSRPHTSAIFLDEHVAGWRLVTARVHQNGGRIFQQLYHRGRKADPEHMPAGEAPIAPSAIKSPDLFGPRHYVFGEPREIATNEVPVIVEQFRNAAAQAKAAGMDGVEIHAANGYLIEQFLRAETNRRTDRYGGSVAHRARFLLEIVEAVIDVWGPGRVGVKITPHYQDGGNADPDPAVLYGYIAHQLNGDDLAYLHAVEAINPTSSQAPKSGAAELLPMLRQTYRGKLIANGAYTRQAAEAVITTGMADLVAFGSLYIANPDLVERFRRDAPLNKPDPATFYVGGVNGYVDYPVLDQTSAAAD